MRLSKKKIATLHIKEPDAAGGKAARRTEQFNRSRGNGASDPEAPTPSIETVPGAEQAKTARPARSLKASPKNGITGKTAMRPAKLTGK